MNRVWLGTLATVALMVSAPACIAVLDWDFEAAPGEGGSGGMGGSGTVASSSTGAGGSAVTSSSSSSGNGGAGGAMDPCPGCTYGARFGDDQEQTLLYMALANDGSLFFTGYYDGELRLDPANAVQDAVVGATQPFLAKLDRTGNPQWITNPLDFKTAAGGGSSVEIASGILAWTGRIQNGSSQDTFVEIRDVNGGRDTTLVRKVYGSPSINDDFRSSALSPDGKTLYVAGVVVGQASSGAFTNCPVMPAFDTMGNQNIVVLAIDTSSGNCLWGNTWSGGNHVGGSISVTTGSDGTPFISGFFVSGTISNKQQIPFPAVPVVQDPYFGAVGFVLKLDKASGEMLAGRGYANAGFVAMTSDPSTATIAAAGGMFGPSITFKGQEVLGPMGMNDGGDNLVLGFDENLNEKWASLTGGPKNQYCPGVSSDRSGRIYAACLTHGLVDRGATINCGSAFGCSVLMPIQSATGTLLSNQIKNFGETEPHNTMGKTFVSAASSAALAVGGTWTAPVAFWDGQVLNPTGSSAMDFDIAVGKVEPIP